MLRIQLYLDNHLDHLVFHVSSEVVDLLEKYLLQLLSYWYYLTCAEPLCFVCVISIITLAKQHFASNKEPTQDSSPGCLAPELLHILRQAHLWSPMTLPLGMEQAAKSECKRTGGEVLTGSKANKGRASHPDFSFCLLPYAASNPMSLGDEYC